MELGRCASCSTPYTTAEVVGLGILRSRPASVGGPRLEYRCPQCRRVIVLVPHGDGRYAPPGVPPPPPVPASARRPQWAAVDEESAEGAAAPPSARSATTTSTPGEPSVPGTSARVPPPPPPPASAPASADAPVTALEALALLGVGPAASRDELERAFRARSLACHPDKVAHLDSEFVDLAERKFKRLMEAFRLLTDV